MMLYSSTGISIIVVAAAVVVFGGYIQHEAAMEGLVVIQTAQPLADRAEVAVAGTVGGSTTYLVYQFVGEQMFPVVYTLTELTVTEVLRGDPVLQDSVIVVRTWGGTYNRVTVSASPAPQFNEGDSVLAYLRAPVTELAHGTYYDSRGVQSTFNLGKDGRYYQQLSNEALGIGQIRSLLGAN